MLHCRLVSLRNAVFSDMPLVLVIADCMFCIFLTVVYRYRVLRVVIRNVRNGKRCLL